MICLAATIATRACIVTIDDRQPLAQMIAAGGYDQINRPIILEHVSDSRCARWLRDPGATM